MVNQMAGFAEISPPSCPPSFDNVQAPPHTAYIQIIFVVYLCYHINDTKPIQEAFS